MSELAGHGPHFAEHNLVAIYATPEDARAALRTLERKGVEAGDIELYGPGMAISELPITNDEQRAADMRTVGAIARRGILGVVLGSVLGVALGLAVAAVMGGSSGALTAAAIGGFVAGAPVGFLFAVYSGLPVNERWADTFETSGGETSVAIHTADVHEIETAIDVLRGTPATRLATCGPDGQLRDVA